MLRVPGILLGSFGPSLTRTLKTRVWFFAKFHKISNFFFVDKHLWGRWNWLLALLATWNFHNVFYTGWIVGNEPQIAPKLTLWVLRPLNNVHWKIDYVVKFKKACQTCLPGVLATWNMYASITYAHKTEKQDGEAPGALFSNQSWLNYDVRLLSLSRV